MPPATERVATAFIDTFALDHLPPAEMQPEFDLAAVPHLAGRPRLNAATEFLDGAVARGWGERRALVTDGETWSYARLLAESNRIGCALIEDYGLLPGQRVLLRGPNSPRMAASWFGVLKAGGIAVTTMPQLRARELIYNMNKAKVSLALCDVRFAAELETAAAATPSLNKVVHFGGPANPGALEGKAARKSDDFAGVDTAAEDIAIIAFTSGTTGKAKGTMHHHRDLVAMCDLFPKSILKATADDLFCGSPPFAFTFGLGGILLFPLRIGAATLLLESAPPPLLAEGIARHRATVCFTAPTAYRAMLPLAAVHDLSSLTRCVSAGEHLPKATFEAWKAATGLSIIDGIGSTEMLHIFISASGDELRPGSTGKAIPGYTAAILDDDGNELPAGELGRLAVRGVTGCRYLDDPERQAAYVQHGWNITGDTYRRDADGYFWYAARSDDMIISGGYNISGVEVENVLLLHPAVAECGVVGVPDEDRGQVVAAYVVTKPGQVAGAELCKTLQEFVKAEIAPYKYPRRIEFVNALPRTETGKLQRFRLRAEGA
ncbi:MAG TPA: AMP-binding protein [Candidatus Eisenbacteria bacterium]